MQRKGIKAKIGISSFLELDPEISKISLLTARTTADMVDKAKLQLLNKIKENAMVLSIEDLTFEEITIPCCTDELKFKI